MNPEPIMAALENALGWAARSSLGAGLLIAIGLALFVAFPKTFGAGWRFCFGVLVLARLLLPVSPESRLSVFNLWPAEPPPAASNVAGTPLLPFPPPARAHGDIIPPTMPEAPAEFAVPRLPRTDPAPTPAATSAPSPMNPPRFDPLDTLPLLWLAGAFTVISIALLRNARFARRVRMSAVAIDDPRLRLLLDQAKQSLGIRQPIPLLAMPRLAGAAVFGWLRPRLLIAEDFGDRFSDVEIRGVFLHELAHVRRHDVFWNWLAHLALAIHWFNPLAWFAIRRFRADREQLCDAVVLRHLSARQRRDYGRTLIALVENFSAAPATVPALAPFLTRKSEIKKRITMIHTKTPPTHWTRHAIAALALAVAGTITFTAAIADDEDERKERREAVREHRAERDGDRERPEARERRGEDREAREREEGAHRHHERNERHEEREHHERRVREHAERARDLDPDGEEFASIIDELKERIGDLAAEGKREQARELEEQIHQMMREHPEQAKRYVAMHRKHEEDAIKKEFHQLERALAEALEDGNTAEARKIQEHMEDIHHANRRRHEELRHRMRDLETALKEAIEEDNETEVREIKNEIEEIHHFARRRSEGQHAERRIHHLRQAAENLEAAGLPEQAHQFHKQAEEIENELRHHHAEGRDEDLARHAEHLEREVAELRDVIAELREHIGKLENELRQGRGRGGRDDD